MRPVKTIIETLEGNKVKVSVEIDEVEFDRNIDQAFRKIAQEVRIPGFRQGKAPRQLLEAQIGTGAARSQAIQDAVPEYLSQAVREHKIDLIATPSIEVTKGEVEALSDSTQRVKFAQLSLLAVTRDCVLSFHPLK